MAIPTLRITDGICPIFSRRSKPAHTFSISKSTQRFTTRVNVATVNPYSYTEVVRPEERKSLTDFLVEVKDFFRDDDGDCGPPRWFSPLECGARAPKSPLLLYIPGIDGTGLGLIRQHKRLGEIFDIWCLHLPVTDRTPARGLFFV